MGGQRKLRDRIHWTRLKLWMQFNWIVEIPLNTQSFYTAYTVQPPLWLNRIEMQCEDPWWYSKLLWNTRQFIIGIDVIQNSKKMNNIRAHTHIVQCIVASIREWIELCHTIMYTMKRLKTNTIISISAFVLFCNGFFFLRFRSLLTSAHFRSIIGAIVKSAFMVK